MTTHPEPGYEYRITEGQRKAWDGEPELSKEGWEEWKEWERFDHHEERYWRRPKPETSGEELDEEAPVKRRGTPVKREKKPVYPPLKWTAAMRACLEANAHKGDDWKDHTPGSLKTRVLEEFDELVDAMDACKSAEAVRREAADVANMAMMVADAYEQHVEKLSECEHKALTMQPDMKMACKQCGTVVMTFDPEFFDRVRHDAAVILAGEAVIVQQRLRLGALQVAAQEACAEYLRSRSEGSDHLESAMTELGYLAQSGNTEKEAPASEPQSGLTFDCYHHYALDVPAVKEGILQGGDARYGCCHHTAAQGHAETCTSDTRIQYVEAALQRAGIGFRRAPE